MYMRAVCVRTYPYLMNVFYIKSNSLNFLVLVMWYNNKPVRAKGMHWLSTPWW